jgi:hypothetical protein
VLTLKTGVVTYCPFVTFSVALLKSGQIKSLADGQRHVTRLGRVLVLARDALNAIDKW